MPRSLKRRVMTASLTAWPMVPSSVKSPVFLVWNSAALASVMFLGRTRKPSKLPAFTWVSNSLRAASSDDGRSIVWTTRKAGKPLGSVLLKLFEMALAKPPVLSRMAIFIVRLFWRVARKIENAKRPVERTGMRMVAKMKPLVCTRVTYSRLTISQNLRTGASDLFDEDVVQRGFHQLKSVDANALLDGGLQDFLRISSGHKPGFNDLAVMIHLLDQRGLVHEISVTGTFNAQRVFTVGLFNFTQVAMEHVSTLMDEADGIAHHLHLLHAVRGEDDGGALGAQFQHDVFYQDGVDGIEAGERFVQNQERGLVNHGGDELNFLLHALGEVNQFLFCPGREFKSLQPLAGSPTGLRLG